MIIQKLSLNVQLDSFCADRPHTGYCYENGNRISCDGIKSSYLTPKSWDQLIRVEVTEKSKSIIVPIIEGIENLRKNFDFLSIEAKIKLYDTNEMYLLKDGTFESCPRHEDLQNSNHVGFLINWGKIELMPPQSGPLSSL